MINPIILAKEVEKIICENKLKKYYRFRKTRFYGGCATADCLGCNLRCAYCWAQKKVWKPEKFGKFYTPSQVFQKLNNMDLPLMRISGGEPTICKDHLFEILSLNPKDKLFILETNGILLDEQYIRELSKFKNIYIRVSLKGVDEETFEKITGAEGKFFKNQLRALELLEKYRIKYRPALLVELFDNKQIRQLGIRNLEFETLIAYSFVIKNLKKRGFNYF